MDLYTLIGIPALTVALHESLRVRRERRRRAPASVKLTQSADSVVCAECLLHVARYDHRGVCANCIAEGK